MTTRAPRRDAALVARWTPPRRFSAPPSATAGRSRRRCTLLDLNGGEPRALTALPDGVDDVRLVARRPAARRRQQRAGRRSRCSEAGRTTPSDARVITRATFRRDGGGLPRRQPAQPPVRRHARATSCAPASSSRSARDASSDQDPVWSADGARIYFTSQTAVEPDYAPPHDGVDGGRRRDGHAEGGGGRRRRGLAAFAEPGWPRRSPSSPR